TPQYMSPEQARGLPVDERADVYAIGAVLYEVLSGRPPHEGQTSAEVLAKVASQPPPPVRAREPALPEHLPDIVDQAMAVDSNARYRNGKQLADDLKRFQTGQLVSAYAYSPPILLRRWMRRHRGALAVAVASLVVLMVTGTLGVLRIVRER